MLKRPISNGPGLVSNLRSTFLTVENARHVIFWYVIYRYAIKAFRHLRSRGLVTSIQEIYLGIARRLFTLVLLTPAAQRRVKRELDAAAVEIRKKIAPEVPDLTPNLSLPAKGKGLQWLERELNKLDNIKASDWSSGKVSGAVYHGHHLGDDLGEAIEIAVQKFILSNPLHPDVFPGVRRMEAEVVKMCLSMYRASPEEGAGTTTSGGTESILLACKAYRDWAREERGIVEPEMVVPASAHAAFDKAGSYFGIKVHRIAADEITRKVDLRSVARAMNGNTIMLVGSAPNFPDGIMDDIPSLAALASKFGIGMHVDCCLGSFIVPFIEKAGFPSEPFDFRVDGVTSISCDTHKYGFAPKGSSVIMYRNNSWRRYQYYVTTDWAGGVYVTATIAGSRPGAVIAGAWAAMMMVGEEGYISSCREIIGAAKRIEAGLRNIPGVRILGKPLSSVVAFASDNVNIYTVGDIMSRKGWHLNALQNPPALHICCTRPTVAAVDDFLSDVRKSMIEAKTSTAADKGDMVLLYGLGSSQVAGPGLVGEVAKMFCDAMYHV